MEACHIPFAPFVGLNTFVSCFSDCNEDDTWDSFDVVPTSCDFSVVGFVIILVVGLVVAV